MSDENVTTIVTPARVNSTVPGLEDVSAPENTALGVAIGAANYWHARAKQAQQEAAEGPSAGKVRAAAYKGAAVVAALVVVVEIFTRIVF